MVYGKSTKNTLRAALEVQFDACISGVESVNKEEDSENLLNEYKVVYASLKCYSKPDSASKISRSTQDTYLTLHCGILGYVSND